MLYNNNRNINKSRTDTEYYMEKKSNVGSYLGIVLLIAGLIVVFIIMASMKGN